jgi:predicted RNA-binding protein YlxR (DUF448 family)
MQKRKPSHKGLRSCLGCGARDEREAMVRIAASGDRVEVDATRRLSGRGGYLHRRADCLERFLNSRVKEFRSLKRKINREERLHIISSIRERLDSGTSVA